MMVRTLSASEGDTPVMMRTDGRLSPRTHVEVVRVRPSSERPYRAQSGQRFAKVPADANPPTLGQQPARPSTAVHTSRVGQAYNQHEGVGAGAAPCLTGSPNTGAKVHDSVWSGQPASQVGLRASSPPRVSHQQEARVLEPVPSFSFLPAPPQDPTPSEPQAVLAAGDLAQSVLNRAHGQVRKTSSTRSPAHGRCN
jgi:hypothetical protein